MQEISLDYLHVRFANQVNIPMKPNFLNVKHVIKENKLGIRLEGWENKLGIRREGWVHNILITRRV